MPESSTRQGRGSREWSTVPPPEYWSTQRFCIPVWLWSRIIHCILYLIPACGELQGGAKVSRQVIKVWPHERHGHNLFFFWHLIISFGNEKAPLSFKRNQRALHIHLYSLIGIEDSEAIGLQMSNRFAFLKFRDGTWANWDPRLWHPPVLLRHNRKT